MYTVTGSAQKTLDRHLNARCARNAKSVESRASDQFHELIRPISQVASRKDATDALGLMRLHKTEGTVVGGSSPLLMANRDLREECYCSMTTTTRMRGIRLNREITRLPSNLHTAPSMVDAGEPNSQNLDVVGDDDDDDERIVVAA
ncbi:uncharacterized protein UDID_17316 [Ustilago sp. UG-2017a]|nr:uncharacterized protein UDID_17316 [Ustilago sp. UG-2017a]